MSNRDMTRAATTVDPSTVDGDALDALTVYLMRYEHIRECIACDSAGTPKVVREWPEEK